MSVKTVLCAFAIVLLGGGQSALAMIQCQGVASCVTPTATFSTPGCISYTSDGNFLIDGVCTTIRECSECSSDYNLVRDGFIQVTNDINCRGWSCQCKGCTSCTSDTTWSATGRDGYEKKVTRECDCATCVVTKTEYRCAENYYGTPNASGTSGCQPCPSSGGVQGKSPAGSTSEEKCCLPGSNVSFDDDKGNGKHKDDSCCYKS